MPFSSSTAGLKTAVKATWKGITNFAVGSGSASAKFFGTSSPMIIETSVAMVTASTVPTASAELARPIAVSGPRSRLLRAGSIVKPVSSVVRVIPSCALDRCVEVIFSAPMTGPSRRLAPCRRAPQDPSGRD